MRCNLGAGRDGLRWMWALQQSSRSRDYCWLWRIEATHRHAVTPVYQLRLCLQRQHIMPVDGCAAVCLLGLVLVSTVTLRLHVVMGLECWTSLHVRAASSADDTQHALSGCLQSRAAVLEGSEGAQECGNALCRAVHPLAHLACLQNA